MASQSKGSAAARREIEGDKPEIETAEANVLEVASERESLNSRMEALARGQQTVLERLDGLMSSTDEQLTEIREVSIERDKRDRERFRALADRIDDVATDPARTSRAAANVDWDDLLPEEEQDGYVRRAMRALKPTRPDTHQVRAIAAANVAEYLALVTAAQVWPVGTLNAISRALFITVS